MRIDTCERAAEQVQRAEKELEILAEDRNRPKGGTAACIAGYAVMTGMTCAESVCRGLVAAEDVVLGIQSSDPTQASLESFFRNKGSGGDDAEADLDALTASLLMSGGLVHQSLVAWGTFEMMGDAYAEIFANK